MGKCFVVQPFDGGRYDKRYKDVLSPAIDDAGLVAYRVDEDPAVNIPIETIQEGIQGCDVVLADITEDNPNVWFEVGFAIASGKAIVLICSADRKSKFPFDVQHRAVITYKTESPSDFNALRKQISARLQAILEQNETLQSIEAMAPAASETKGLTPHEIAALIIAMESRLSERSIWPQAIASDMERHGFTKLAASLSIEGLVRKQMLQESEVDDDFGNRTRVYSLTEKGLGWVMNNQNQFKTKIPKRPTKVKEAPF